MSADTILVYVPHGPFRALVASIHPLSRRKQVPSETCSHYAGGSYPKEDQAVEAPVSSLLGILARSGPFGEDVPLDRCAWKPGRVACTCTRLSGGVVGWGYVFWRLGPSFGLRSLAWGCVYKTLGGNA